MGLFQSTERHFSLSGNDQLHLNLTIISDNRIPPEQKGAFQLAFLPVIGPAGG